MGLNAHEYSVGSQNFTGLLVRIGTFTRVSAFIHVLVAVRITSQPSFVAHKFDLVGSGAEARLDERLGFDDDRDGIPNTAEGRRAGKRRGQANRGVYVCVCMAGEASGSWDRS